MQYNEMIAGLLEMIVPALTLRMKRYQRSRVPIAPGALAERPGRRMTAAWPFTHLEPGEPLAYGSISRIEPSGS